MDEKIKINKKSSALMLAAVGIVLGIVILLAGSFESRGSEREGEDTGSAELDAKIYEQELEEKIRELCYDVRGVGGVEVMVSLKGGYKTVYAMDAQASSGGYRSEIVKVGSGSNQNGIIIGYENPEIIGVGIVCEGGDDARVRGEIVSLVSAALDISSNKIFVAAGGESRVRN